MDESHDLFVRLWHDYRQMNPQAGAIHQLLQARGETIVNDHIALRTFDDPHCNIDVLARPFLALGYQARDSYVFTEKKLLARYYSAPAGQGADGPRVFISQLRLDEFSPALREIVRRLLDSAPPDTWQRQDLPVAGRPWSLSFADYQSVSGESEYAGWVAAFGFRANHFTVSVNALKTFPSGLAQFNEFLKSAGFALNVAGGEIKGGPEVLLEQSSTLAAHVPVAFADGPHVIPSCYYEFARRYPLPDGSGRLFDGFVEKSADKIFESTNRPARS